VWQERVEQVIERHAAEPTLDGLFLLYALHSVHSPMQAPVEGVPSAACAKVPNEHRRNVRRNTYCLKCAVLPIA